MTSNDQALSPPSVAGKSSRWGQDRRLEFIDFRLQWEGRLNRSDLTEFFGISVPQASVDLARYMELAPRNIEYDRREKTYQATPVFVPALTAEDGQSYLTQLAAVSAGVVSEDAAFIGWLPPVGVALPPNRQLDTDILKLALRAIRASRVLHIEYQSLSRAAPSKRSVSPHALGFDGFRWHLRAYCHEKRDFRDFVFARILSMSAGEASDVSAEHDRAWQLEVELVLAPHPGLSEPQRRAIELDYGMHAGRVELRTRQALLFYVLRQLHLEQSDGARAESQQIVLVNRDEILPLLVDASSVALPC